MLTQTTVLYTKISLHIPILYKKYNMYIQIPILYPQILILYTQISIMYTKITIICTHIQIHFTQKKNELHINANILYTDINTAHIYL